MAFLGVAAAVPLIAAMAVTVSVSRPTIAIVLVLSPAGILLARRSVAYPVALFALPTLVIALLRRDPFPHGLVTALYFAWMFVGIVFALMKGEQKLPLRLLLTGPVMFSVLLAIDLLARLPASLSPGYGSTKLQLFLLQNLILLIAGTLIGQRRWHLERLLYVELILAAVIGVVLLWHLARGDAQTFFANRYTISAQENPIQLGRESADGLIVATWVLLAATRPAVRLAAAAVLPVLVVTLLSSGSRGPVLGAVVGLVTLMAVLAHYRSARRRLLLVAVSGAAASVLATQLVPGQSMTRSLSFLIGSGSGLDSNGRTTLWSQAWSHFLQHPVFGIGTGSFRYFVAPLESYPHNLVLETAVELGLVGAILAVGFLVSSWLAMARTRFLPGPAGLQAAVVIALFTSAVVNAMFSGDITTNANVWLAAGLGLGLAMRADGAPDTAVPLVPRRP